MLLALVSLGPGTLPAHRLLPLGTEAGTAASHSGQCAMGQRRCCCPERCRQTRTAKPDPCHRTSPAVNQFPGIDCAWSPGCERQESLLATTREQSGWPAQEQAACSALANTDGNLNPLRGPTLPQGHHPSLFRPPRIS